MELESEEVRFKIEKKAEAGQDGRVQYDVADVIPKKACGHAIIVVYDITYACGIWM